MNDIRRAIETLEGNIRGSADDAETRYQIATLLLNQYNTPPGESQHLRRALEHLERAIEIRPEHARSHASLGYAHYMTGLDDRRSLECFQEARRLDPENRVVEVFVLKLLSRSGRTAEALAAIETAAARHEVDLEALRRELKAANFSTDPGMLVMNGFLHAENWFRSSIDDEGERILNGLDPARAGREAAAARKHCNEQQEELAQSFDSSRVPEALRDLAPLASRFGVGDDHCRPFLLRRLSKMDRKALIGAVDAHGREIQNWLDSFAQGAMTDEAVAFMYLALGAEEIRE